MADNVMISDDENNLFVDSAEAVEDSSSVHSAKQVDGLMLKNISESSPILVQQMIEAPAEQ